MAKEVIKRFLKLKLLSRITAVMLISVMLLLAGCDNKELPSKTDGSETSSVSEPENNSGSENSGSEESTPEDSSSEDVSSEETDSVNSDNENNSSEEASSDNSVSSEDDSSDDTDSSEENKDTSGEPDPALGTFTFEETVTNENLSQEIIPVGNTANLSNPLKGYKDKEAEALRKEILNTGNTEEYYKITGTKYYISSLNGDDLNSGKSPKEAFKSFEGLSGIEFQPGDAVLLERGSVFRLYSTFLTKEGVTYGSYGKGEKPKIYGSAVNLSTVVWSPSVKKNVWQIDYVYAECAGMFFNHGKEVGFKRTGLRNLKKNTDFYQDPSSDTLYVYCDKGNPAKVYESIEFSTQMSILGIPSGVDNVTIDNLCIKYGGIMGVSGTWNTDHINVTNCEIGYIGGGTTSGGTSRYGNAIQFWTGANDIVCDHNWIYQTWDTAISWQGYGGEKYTYNNISFSDNLLEYNNADFEYWDDGSSIDNFVVANNIMRFTSLGWGTREDDGGYRGIDGPFSGGIEEMTVKNHYITDNIIDCPGRYIINWAITPEDLNKNIFISGTEIYVNSSYRTTDVILRGFKTDKSQPNSVETDKSEVFVETLKRFDPDAVLEWH